MEKESKVGMIAEHKRLVKVLTSGSKIEQMNEAKKQNAELQAMLKTNTKKSIGIKGLI